jgi:hypothetical protein
MKYGSCVRVRTSKMCHRACARWSDDTVRARKPLGYVCPTPPPPRAVASTRCWPMRGMYRARNRSDAAQLWWPPPAAAAASNLRKTSARTVHQPQGIGTRSACRGGCQVAFSLRGSRLDEVVGSIARSLLDARDAWAACPAHVCKQEDGQTMDMRSHEHSGSHSKPRSEGASASGRRDQTSGTRRQGHWVRGLEASSAPLDAVEG